MKKCPITGFKQKNAISSLNLLGNKNSLSSQIYFPINESTFNKKTTPKGEEKKEMSVICPKQSKSKLNTSIKEIIHFYRETKQGMERDCEKIEKNYQMFKLKQNQKKEEEIQIKNNEKINESHFSLKATYINFFILVASKMATRCGRGQLKMVRKVFSSRTREHS